MLARVQLALKEIQKTETRLARMAAQLEAKLPLLQDQARLAISQSREDLARNALERRRVAEVELANIRAQLEEVELEERQLSLVESRLSSQIEAFYARQEVIAARYSAAEAQVQIQEMKARAFAIDRLVEEGMLGTAAAREVPMDFMPTPAIEGQLQALKREAEEENNLEG
jgi:phage shock protein A